MAGSMAGHDGRGRAGPWFHPRRVGPAGGNCPGPRAYSDLPMISRMISFDPP